MVEEKYLTPRECARELGISLDRIYTLLWSGRLAASKNDRGEWRVPAGVVEQRKEFVAAYRQWERPVQEAQVSV
jgi:excisionase family DNA binding protein